MPPTLRCRSLIRLPSDIVLTTRSIIAIAARLKDAEVSDLIDALIAQLDARDADVDLEPEPEMRGT